MKINLIVTSAGRWSGKVNGYPLNGRVSTRNAGHADATIARRIAAQMEEKIHLGGRGNASAVRGGGLITVSIADRAWEKAAQREAGHQEKVASLEKQAEEKERARLQKTPNCPVCGLPREQKPWQMRANCPDIRCRGNMMP